MRRHLAAVVALAVIAFSRESPAQAVRGQVTNEQTGAPVNGVSVNLLDSAGVVLLLLTTPSDGRFELRAPAPGSYRVRFLVPGYRQLVTPMLNLATDQTIEYPLKLAPIAPRLLDTLLVEGKPVPRLLAGFYQRRQVGHGDYATREEFERWAAFKLEDVVRRISPFVALPGAGRGFRSSCQPVLLVNGGYVAAYGEMEDLTPIETIEAVEVYRSPNVPAELDRLGGYCAVVAVWSRIGGPGGRSRHLALGAHVGGAVMGAETPGERVGLSAVIGFSELLELYLAANAIVNVLDPAAAAARSGLQAIAALRGRPLGRESGWYVGAGVTVIGLRTTGNDAARDDTHAIFLTGAHLVAGRARPFVELQLVIPFGAAELHSYAGLRVRVY